MKQTAGVNRRPSGTDGSDYSYRMVVDSRYKKVAEGKSRLRVLIPAQAFIQLIVVFLFVWKRETVDPLAVSSLLIFFISLLIGDLGRKRSHVNFLKVYLFGSSVSSLTLIVYLLKKDPSLEILLNMREAPKLEVLNAATILFGGGVQIFAAVLVSSLLGNMAPPKRRAS